MVIITKEVLAELKGSFSELWHETWPILGATAVMVTVVLLLREFAFMGLPNFAWAELVLLSVSGAATYFAALFAMGRPVIGEGAEVIRWIILRHRGDDS